MITPAPRRYLLINPNTNPLTTQRLQEVLQPQVPDLVPLTSPVKPAMRLQRMRVWMCGQRTEERQNSRWTAC